MQAFNEKFRHNEGLLTFGVGCMEGGAPAPAKSKDSDFFLKVVIKR